MQLYWLKNVFISKKEPVFLALKHMFKEDLDLIPVIDDNCYCGAITKSQLLDKLIWERLQEPCANVLTQDIECLIQNNLNVETLASFLKNFKYDNIPLCENGSIYIGIIKRLDLFKYILWRDISSNNNINTSFGVVAWNNSKEIVYINDQIRDQSISVNIGDKLSQFFEILLKKIPNYDFSNIIYIKFSKITVAIICFNDKDYVFFSHIISSKATFDKWELDSILNSIYDGVYITDSRGTTLAVNDAWERITGIKKASVIGKKVQELEGEGFFSPITTTEVLRINKPVTVLQKIYGGKQVVCTGNPLHDSLGNISKVVTNVRDITELINIKEALDKATKQNENYKKEINKLKIQNIKKEIVIEDPAMQHICELALNVANVDSTVLITGESGVGKDIIAELIYKNSKRKHKPFLHINCGTIPENLLESEFFGYEGGSFTGAAKTGKVGIFELADNGTIFLDEIGDLPLSLQVKILRVLQSGEFWKVGGRKQIKINVRIIAATNRNLKKLIQEGRFRSDLYYRLNVVHFHIPPLRERPKDIKPLINLFLAKFNKKYNSACFFDYDAIELLLDYKWPGNVRELENTIERLVVTSFDNKITKEQVENTLNDKELLGDKDDVVNVLKLAPLKTVLSEAEKQLMVLARKKYHTTYEIASVLDVSQPTVVRKLKMYKIKS